MSDFKMWTCYVVPESGPRPRVWWTNISAIMNHCHEIYSNQGGYWMGLQFKIIGHQSEQQCTCYTRSKSSVRCW